MENFGYAMGSIERLHRLPRVLDLVTKVIQGAYIVDILFIQIDKLLLFLYIVFKFFTMCKHILSFNRPSHVMLSSGNHFISAPKILSLKGLGIV